MDNNFKNLKSGNASKVKVLKERYQNYKFHVKQPILDIGGANGDFLEFQGIKDATIIDLSVPEYPKFNFKYIKADVSKELPEIKKKYRTIFITEVLEHVKNPLYLLSQAYNLLENDGICYISIPYTEIGPDHHHVCRWTQKEILDQTKKLGFIPKVIQKRRRFMGLAFFLPHCWLVLALKKRSNNRGGDHRVIKPHIVV